MTGPGAEAGMSGRQPSSSRLRPRSATSLPSLRERRPLTGRVGSVSDPPAPPPPGGNQAATSSARADHLRPERRIQSERRPSTSESARQPWLIDYLSRKDPLYAPDRPPVPDYGYDRHNFWYHLESKDEGHGAGRRKFLFTQAEDPDRITPWTVTLDMDKRTRIAKRFIERNHQRMWKFRSNFCNKSPQEMLDTIVNNMHFDVFMHDLLRRERDYRAGRSSEQMWKTLQQREEYRFGDHDPFLSSITTTRSARRLRQEHLFMPAYSQQIVTHHREKAAWFVD